MNVLIQGVMPINVPKNVDKSGWRVGRRVVEIGLLLEQLRYCCKCRLGPVPLTCDNVLGELKKGLGGYLYAYKLVSCCPQWEAL